MKKLTIKYSLVLAAVACVATSLASGCTVEERGPARYVRPAAPVVVRPAVVTPVVVRARVY